MSEQAPEKSAETEATEAPFTVSPAQRRRLQKCFEFGQQKLAAGDHDYAHDMFADCVVHDPGNLTYVEALLDNLQKKYKNNRRGARSAFGGASKGPFKKALSKQDFAEVLRLGPELLKSNPWDVVVLRGMAEACAHFGYNEAELRYLKNALDANPKDADVNRHCARSLARMGQFDMAIACWHRVEEAKPGDAEPPKMISELTLAKARGAAGFDDEATDAAGNPAPVKPAARPAPEEPKPKPAPEQPAARRQIPLTPRQRLERAILDYPADVQNYYELAILHIDEGRPYEADRLVEKIRALAGADLAWQRKLEDLQIRKMERQAAIAQQRAQANPGDEEAANLARQLQADLNRLEIEIYGARVQQMPQDRRLKFELGVRLKRAGNHAEAARTFSEAREDESLKAVSTLEMGECLQALKQYAKALQCYQRAAELAAEPNLKKLSLYRAGVLAMGLKQVDVALALLTELAGLDAGYKDVAERLDKLRRLGHNP